MFHSRPGLSKSRITAFELCTRRLWLQTHRPELADMPFLQQQRIDDGHAVGALACAQQPGGIMVEAEPDLAAAVIRTRELIDAGHPGPIFEATFEHDGVLVRVDILSRDGADGWSVAEVKSSSKVKDYYIGDLATQVWVLRHCGLHVTRAVIRHLNSEFELQREGDFDGIFTDVDLMAAIEPIIALREQTVISARDMLTHDEPEALVGSHCSKPVPCTFAGWCHDQTFGDTQWPVTMLPKGAGTSWLQQGVRDMLDLKEGDLQPIPARVLAATRSGQPFHDVAGARQAIGAWGWPRAWLDFETIGPAIPRWIGTRPYQHIPFQFSLHLEQEDGSITHHAFLDLSGADPQAACAEALVRLIPADATIIAYFATFEKGVMSRLAKALPDYADALTDMAARTVDLLPVTRDHWYHRDQRGSWSIKAVLPTISDLGYAGLSVKDGGDAQMAYLEATDPATKMDRKSALEEGLLAYCRRDTQAMIAVARRLVVDQAAELALR